MELSSKPSPRLRTSLLSWVLGFLGITALVKFLPRTISYAVRRWVLGIVAEIVFVTIAGLLTGKLVDRMAARNGSLTTKRSGEAARTSPHAGPNA